MSLVNDYTYQILQQQHLADLRAEVANDRLARLAQGDRVSGTHRAPLRWTGLHLHRMTRHPSVS